MATPVLDEQPASRVLAAASLEDRFAEVMDAVNHELDLRGWIAADDLSESEIVELREWARSITDRDLKEKVQALVERMPPRIDGRHHE